VASLILIVAMFVLLWVLLIRPQRKRQQDQQRLIESVEPGDEILTVGGIYGIVEELDEEEDLVVEIAEGIRVRVARRAVASVVKPEEEDEEELVEGEAEAIEVDAVKEGEQDVRSEAAEDPAEPSRR
jgi:preprotein translocase subunit YajC